MSAFICNPEHIAALAAYVAFRANGREDYVLPELRGKTSQKSAANCAKALAKANSDSITARYGEAEDPAYIAECGKLAKVYCGKFPKLSAVDIIKMAQCLRYQCCEVSDWDATLACRQIYWIIDCAHTQLPGYNDAPWEWAA